MLKHAVLMLTYAYFSTLKLPVAIVIHVNISFLYQVL